MIACCTASNRASSLKSFVKNSCAPAVIARIDVGISPLPVGKSANPKSGSSEHPAVGSQNLPRIEVWFLIQLLNVGATAAVQTGGMAYVAHIGGPSCRDCLTIADDQLRLIAGSLLRTSLPIVRHVLEV